MSNDVSLLRQWLLLKTLCSRHQGVTVQAMAAELEVAEKTIRRDLATFASVGFPLEESVGPRGQKSWKIATSPAGRPDLAFSLDEVLALYLARRFLEPLAGTVIWTAALSAFRKVRASLSRAALDYLDRMAGSLYPTGTSAGKYEGKAELLNQLMLGLEDRRATHIVYRSLKASEPVTYEVFPYGLAYHRGSLYLVAFSREHDEVRHFKLDRMIEAEASAFPFEPPADFELSRHFAGSFGVYQGRAEVRVRVRFSRDVARYVQESTWHASQRLEPERDGGVVAEFRLSSTEEIKRWILSFGRHAEVLEPAELCAEMSDEARALAARYDGAAARVDSGIDRRPARRGRPRRRRRPT